MSAYIVEVGTIQNVLFSIKPESLLRISQKVNELSDRTRIAFDPRAEPETALYLRFGQAMVQLNEDAVNARYKHGDVADPYTHAPALCSKLCSYKSLRCWLYQCCEGECESDPLYQVMKDLCADWAHALVASMPEYESAKDW